MGLYKKFATTSRIEHLKPLTVHAFAIFFNAAISFITVVILTHYLSESDYGIINLYNAFTIFLMPFIGVGIQFLLNVEFFKMNADEYRSEFSNAVFIPVILSIVFTILFAIFFFMLKNIIKVNFFFIIILPFSCLILVLNETLLNIIRNKNKYWLFAGFSMSKNIIEVGLTVFFVVSLGMAWQGRLTGALIALIFVGGVILYLIKKWNFFENKIQYPRIKSIAQKGSPFILERVAIFFMGYSDRFFIDHYNGVSDVGLYGAGAQIAIIVGLSVLALNNVFHPTILKSLAGEKVQYNVLKRDVIIYIGISGLITLLVISFSPIFFKFFIGEKFHSGSRYTTLLSIGLFFWSIYNVFFAFLLSARKNKLIMAISVAGMILSVSSNFFMVKYFGALGAAYTSIFVYFFMALMVVFFVNRIYGIKRIFFS